MPRCRPTRGASAGHVRRRRGSRRATVLVMDPDAPPSAQPSPEADDDAASERDDGLDLATLGLAVFFVAVIAIVAALLIVQNLF